MYGLTLPSDSEDRVLNFIEPPMIRISGNRGIALGRSKIEGNNESKLLLYCFRNLQK
jgi:hypothetical protein